MSDQYTSITDLMTEDMLAAWQPQETFVTEWRLCKAKEVQAGLAARTSLPATSHTGVPVIHGARLALFNVEDYWRNRRRAAELMLDNLRLRQLEAEWDSQS